MKKECIECLCGSTNVELQTYVATEFYHEKEYHFEVTTYNCKDCGLEWEQGEMFDKNMQSFREAIQKYKTGC